MLMGWGMILYRQRSGYYLCQTVHVQFNDDFSPKLAAFSGLYDYCDGRSHKCPTGHYQERGHGNYANTAQLGYCKSERAWTFSHVSAPSDEHDICQWGAKSGKIDPYEGEAFDIMGSADFPWSTKNDAGTTVPLPTFSLQCFDCKHDADFCGGAEHGECINNRCVCKDGWYGIRCEFPEPCDELEIDPLYPSFQGSTDYTETFQRMKMDNTSMSEISVYNRPAYLGSSQGGFLDLIFYNGRRWAMISGASSRTSQGMGKEEMIKMARGFHGYWSDYKVSFLSEPVDIDTPEDAVSPVGLAWFPVQTLEQDRGVDQFPDLKRSTDTRLLCTTCTNETSQNPCLFQGICGEDGRCECTTGSTGRLCQIQPVGNGLCNPYFNTPEFGYDGGDCCHETCVDGEHICGKGVIGDEFGVEAYGYVGYKDCLDPTVTKVSGSQTLHTILNRGYLKCGSGYRTAALDDFHTQVCGALAAAIFGGAGSIEMVDSSAGNHFVSILDGEHDVQFGYDLTASSDIFEVSSGSPFSFVALSNFYGGLLFAGIPPFGLCADRGDHSSSECQGMKVCVLGNSTWYNVSASIFPEEILVGVLTQDDAILGIETGRCNVIAGHQSEIDEQSIREAGFAGTEYEMGSTLHTKSFETLLMSGKDRVWSKFVSWVFEALVDAEESGITTETADQMAVTDVFC